MHHPKPVDQALMLMCTKLSTTGEFPHTMNNYPNIHTLPTQQKYISVESFICMMHGSSLLYWLLLVSSQLKQKGCFVQIVALFSVYLPRVWFSLRSSQGCNDVVVFDFSADCLPQRWLTISDHLPVFILFHPVSIFASEVHAAVRLSLLPAPSDRQVHKEYFHSLPRLPRHHLSWVSALPHWFCPWWSPLPAGFGVFGHGAVTMPWQVFGEETKSEAPFDPFVRLANQHTACWWKSIQRAFKEHSTKSQAASTAKGHYLCSCSGVAEMGLC